MQVTFRVTGPCRLCHPQVSHKPNKGFGPALFGAVKKEARMVAQAPGLQLADSALLGVRSECSWAWHGMAAAYVFQGWRGRHKEAPFRRWCETIKPDVVGKCWLIQ